MADVTSTEALDVAYTGLLALVEKLDDEQAWSPTGCTGWTVRDLVFHLLRDAERALVAFGTPADGAADVDAVTYWRSWRPGTPEANASLRNTRIMASVWSSITPLAELYAETARAVMVQARRLDPDALVRTQGYTIAVGDLLSTLAVEATVHHLDLTACLPAPGPAAESLALVRRVLDGLACRPLAEDWDDERYVRVGTGRATPTDAERASLGSAAGLLPLLG